MVVTDIAKAFIEKEVGESFIFILNHVIKYRIRFKEIEKWVKVIPPADYLDKRYRITLEKNMVRGSFYWNCVSNWSGARLPWKIIQLPHGEEFIFKKARRQYNTGCMIKKRENRYRLLMPIVSTIQVIDLLLQEFIVLW